MNIKKIGNQLKSLAVFRCLLNDDMIKAFIRLCDEESSKALGEFAQSLYCMGDNISAAFLHKVLLSENLMSVKCASDSEISSVIKQRAKAELEIIKTAAELESEMFGYPNLWITQSLDFEKAFEERLKNIKQTGYGVFAENIMFTLENGEIIPAIFKDDTTVDSLKGYERQRMQIENNIKALIKGKVAANMLLYGDSGTGKSATVKALANFYAEQGVRLIEIKKSQISEIPYIMGKVSSNPLKFILFLDDLTFDPNDDAFGSMKAVLEGSVAARAKNTCICVTSNRRHLVKESAKDREMGDLHVRDTMEEIGALTQRFGLSVVYEKPDRLSYIKVLEEIAADHNIEIGEAEIKEAEAYAISKGGRSCRVAKQYVEELIRRMD
ncbi:MAG: DUF815 domain-containing protein [Clostridia bacterium]|nr:DUF815 domain-containing protein [Clostridia bacterium]